MDGIEEIKTALGELKDAAGVVGDLKTQVTKLAGRLDAEKREREDLELRLSSLNLGGGSMRVGDGTSPLLGYHAAAAEAKAVAGFARRGDDSEMKAMAVGDDTAGGFLVLPQMSQVIQARTFELSPVAKLARSVAIGTGDAWEEVRDLADYEASWTAETEARPETAGSDLVKDRITLDELYANVKITQRLIDDSAFDIASHVTNQIADRFARATAAALTSGNGVGRPRGIIDYATAATADATRDWGTIEHVATTASGAFAASNPADQLISMVYKLKASYRPRAAWLMNSTVAATIRKFKDSTGQYLWQEAVAEGQPSRLLGHAVHLSEDMPDPSANSLSVLFVDFTGYVVVTRPGIRILRDPYSAKPYVYFYATMRVGGGLVDFDAIKALKFSAA